MDARISIYEANDIKNTNKKWVGLYIGTNPNSDHRHYLGTGYGNGQHEIDAATLKEVARVYPYQFESTLKDLQIKLYNISKEKGRWIGQC